MSVPGRVLSLWLSCGNYLHVEYVISTEEAPRLYGFSLDLMLGNHEGCFDPDGCNFSRSARDVRMRGNIVYAQLSTSSAVWWDDQIAIDVELPLSPVQVIPFVKARRCDHLRFSGFHSLRLIDSYILVAEFLRADGSYWESYLDLDRCIGSEKGVFDRHGTRYLFDVPIHVMQAHVVGTYLCAYLKFGVNKAVWATIDLASVLRITDGALKPLRGNIGIDRFELEVIKDEYWLSDVRNVRLLNCRRKRMWYLLANCVTHNGSIYESAFKLSEIIGPTDGEMFAIPWFSNPDLPEEARYIELENGILTASFQAEGDGNQWVQRSADLKDVVINQGGKLTLKQFGSTCLGCGHLFLGGAFFTNWRGGHSSMDMSAVKRVRSHCTLCQLVWDTFEYYKSPAGFHDVRFETSSDDDPLYATRVAGQTTSRKVELVVTTYPTSEKLRSVLKRKKGAPISEVRCMISVEHSSPVIEGDPQNGATAVPKRFRTLLKSEVGPLWLQPDQRWLTIRHWIWVCSTEHDCCPGNGMSELPSRYLDLGVRNQDPVRLASDQQIPTSYVCLSHCWGGKSHCTLTADTEALFREGIPRHLLPPVFQDAIDICRRLGFRYLWIDSLCIQQDSKDDWLYESGRMGMYYANCAVCLAATSAANSLGSMKIASRPSVIRADGTDPFSGPFCLIASPLEPQSHFFHAREQDDLSQDFPLLTRAWVFQERWLPPRVLHFCHSEVVFECTETMLCECGRVNDSIFTGGKALGSLPRLAFQSIMRATSTANGLVARRARVANFGWDKMVSAYSWLNLTFPTDRLIAISGLASTIHESDNLQGDKPGEEASARYLAGLWRQTLARDMAWFTGESMIRSRDDERRVEVLASCAKRKPRPAQYLAPTWSWASILDGVRYLWDIDPKHLFEVAETHIALSTADPFGMVDEGCFLHIRGKVLESAWQLSRGTEAFILTDLVGTQQLDKNNAAGVRFSPDYNIEEDGPHQIRPTSPLYVFPMKTLPLIYSFGPGEEAKGLSQQEMDDRKSRRRTTLCLVLKKSTALYGRKDPVYERMGFTEYGNWGGEWSTDPNEHMYKQQEFYII